jgi:hypothetical protein
MSPWGTGRNGRQVRSDAGSGLAPPRRASLSQIDRSPPEISSAGHEVVGEALGRDGVGHRVLAVGQVDAQAGLDNLTVDSKYDEIKAWTRL